MRTSKNTEEKSSGWIRKSTGNRPWKKSRGPGRGAEDLEEEQKEDREEF